MREPVYQGFLEKTIISRPRLAISRRQITVPEHDACPDYGPGILYNLNCDARQLPSLAKQAS